ncbi:MAG: hypothetical protein WCR42_01035 [bacterium]
MKLNIKESVTYILKTSIICLLLCLSTNLYGQDSSLVMIFSHGLITFVDRTPKSNFAISYKGDTARQEVQYKNILVIDDTTAMQIHKYKIPDDMKSFKFDSLEEAKLLEHFRDYEFNYSQDEVYQAQLKCESIFFKNQNSKQFLLWYFKVPDYVAKMQSSLHEKDSTHTLSHLVIYQLYLAFTTGTHVTMINFPVMYNEDLSEHINTIKNDVANSVRYSDFTFDIRSLQLQLAYKQEQKPFTIVDTIHGFQCNIPDWLNIISIKNNSILATFPDINNISNTFSIVIIEKPKADSFKDFQKFCLKLPNVISYQHLESSNSHIARYKVLTQAPYGRNTSYYSFLELKVGYAVFVVEATEGTYPINLEKINEFLNSIIIY